MIVTLRLAMTRNIAAFLSIRGILSIRAASTLQALLSDGRAASAATPVALPQSVKQTRGEHEQAPLDERARGVRATPAALRHS